MPEKIRKYRVITWGHWIYFAICAFAFATMPLVIFSNRAEPHQRLLSVAVLAAFPVISWFLFKNRLAYARAIRWYTPQGIAVLPGDAEAWLTPRRAKLDGQIQTALHWWQERYPDEADKLQDFLNGRHLAVVVQDQPLQDMHSGMMAREFTEPGKIRLWWPAKPAGTVLYLKGYEGRDPEDLFFALVRHAVGHWCLYAMHRPDEAGSHHAQMSGAGCPDA
jgi:hypothetical protein